MPIKKVFCPSCGHETQINDEKPFSFCTECGNKIVLHSQSNSVDKTAQDENSANDEIDKKLEEAAFYYKLSYEKKEYENTRENPTYYLKAQDLLVDLSDQYPDDYRIWWELCKPIDYLCSSEGVDVYNQYRINEDYFNKALDRADLPKKRKLIDEHDKYVNNKAAAIELAEKKLAEQEKLRIEKETAEKKAYEEKCERERIRREQEEENLRKKAEEENKRREFELIEKEKRLAAERESNQASSKSLWEALSNKDYSMLNNKYFEIKQENNQIIIVIFKLISNMLYLNAFRIDGNKGNTIYQEQSFAMQFNSEGYGIKFDKSNIRIKGFMPPDNLLRITKGQSEAIYVNDRILKSDNDYISNIIKNAKKPLLSFTKIFN